MLRQHEPFIDALADGALIVDLTGTVVCANAAAERIFAAPREVLFGPIHDYPRKFSLRAATGQVPARLITLRALAGELVPPIELYLQRADSPLRVLRASAGPLRDQQGDIEGALLVIGHVPRPCGLDELGGAERVFRDFFDSMPEPGWTARADGFADFFNRGFLTYTGATLEEMQGWGWRAVHEPAWIDQVVERWSRALEQGVPFEMEFPLRRYDGAFRWFITRVNPLRGPDGRIVRWIGITTDIHAQKVAETEKAELLLKAQEANRAKDEFLAMLGHELRNPLAPILTAVQLMKLREKGPSREREVIERQAQHLVRLVDDLLDVSRVVRGHIELRRKPLQLREVVLKGVEIASPALEKATHHLEVAVPEELWLDADDVRIAQVVANLVTNAAKYTPPGGHVLIAARRDGAQVELTVEDDGLGIEPDLLPRVFDLFVQGARGIDRSEGGLGLGLALVRTLTELHGGKVEARSEGRGRGTQLVVRLPALDRAPPGSAPEPAFAQAARGRRVLVVDDNSDAAEGLASLLREAGHEVATALDAASAELTARSFAPEIALLDLGLPVVDGIELGRRLQAFDASLRLVAVTGYGAEHDKRRTEAAGFGAHLVKPVSVDALLASLEG